MGLRFQKRITLFKGLSVNLSKSGLSWTIGRPGASVNVRSDKVAGSVGLPGTGLSYRQTLLSNNGTTQTSRLMRSLPKLLFWLILVLVVGYLLLR